MNLSQSRGDYYQFDWIKVRLPQEIDEIFQDITDVKIQFNTGSEYNEAMVVTVTKEPNQTTKVSKLPKFVDFLNL